MFDVVIKHNVGFLLIRKGHNKPGTGFYIANALKAKGIVIDQFFAVGTPEGKEADAIFVAVHSAKAKEAVRSLEEANGEIAQEKPLLLSALIGITVEGFRVQDSSSVITLVFEICYKLQLNIIVVHTSFASLNIWVDAKEFKEEMKNVFQEELNSLWKTLQVR